MPPGPGIELPEQVRDRYKEMGLNRNQALTRSEYGGVGILSVVGTKQFPVVLMAFSDVASTYDSGDFNQMLFEGPWDPGTAHDYYNDVSYGKVDVKGQVYGQYTADHTASYYANNEHGIGNDYERSAGLLVYEACKKSDPSVDFSLYDNDGDGYVDVFTVVHVGQGAEETGDKGDIWSHEFSLSGWGYYGGPGEYETDDPDPNNPGSNIKIDVYTMNPELSDYSVLGEGGISNIGVFCHEWGHGFGLPDLYVIEGDYAGAPGLGDFCLMASGSWGAVDETWGSSPVHLCAWCKHFLGWLEPEALERGAVEEVTDAEFPASSENPCAWRIFANPSDVDWSFESVGIGEYFLIENRRRKGFDRSLPGEGLLILHVDESQETNSYLENPLVGIMQADGDDEPLYISEYGSGSDLWSDDAEGFTNFSIPSSRFYDGVASGASVRNISAARDTMKADLEIGAVLLAEVISYPNPFNVHEHDNATIRYLPSDEEKVSGQYPDIKVYIYNLAGQRVRVLDEKPREVSVYGRVAYWDGRNDNERAVASGLYFYIIELREGDEVIDRSKGKLTLIR